MKTNEQELISLYCANNEQAQEALINQYKDLIWYVIRHEVRSEYFPLLDEEDLYQEGLLGLDGAIRAYKPEYGSPFLPLAKTCIRRRIMNYVKHFILPVQQYKVVSLDSRISEDGNMMMHDVVPARRAVSLDELDIPDNFLSFLTLKEKRVMQYRKQGYSYQEIADMEKVSKKSIDNTIQKVRKKYRRMIERAISKQNSIKK